MSTEAIADASFIINRARYSRQDLLFKVFDVVWIPEPVLGELRSERSVMWVAEKLAAGAMALFPELPNYRDEALRLMEIGGRYPIRRLDYPEAYCIAVADDRGFVGERCGIRRAVTLREGTRVEGAGGTGRACEKGLHRQERNIQIRRGDKA